MNIYIKETFFFWTYIFFGIFQIRQMMRLKIIITSSVHLNSPIHTNKYLYKSILLSSNYSTLIIYEKKVFYILIITIIGTIKVWIKMKITETENITANICINKSRNLKINQLEDTTISNLRLFIFDL